MLGKYNYKHVIIEFELEDLPHDAIELYKQEHRLLAFKTDIQEIVKWLV